MHATQKPPLPQGDMGLPTLKVGLNELQPEDFEAAVLKLVQDPDAQKAARKSGGFAVEGAAGSVRVKRGRRAQVA